MERIDDTLIMKNYLKPFGYTVTVITWYQAWNLAQE
jgi:hypothetical protein